MGSLVSVVALAGLLLSLAACESSERAVDGAPTAPALPAVITVTPLALQATSAQTTASEGESTPMPDASPAIGATSSSSKGDAARPSVVARGAPAPDFELTLLTGEGLRLSDLEGQVVVLNFWASWCKPCLREMPAFERVWQEYRERGVVFMGVAVSDIEELSRAFAEDLGVTYPLGMDSTGRISRAYEVVSIPATYFIDRQGNAARRFVGVANEGVLRVFLAGQLGTE